MLIWIVFILYESLTIGWLLGVFGNPITYVAHYVIIISLFYLHADWSLPWALKNNKTILWKLPFILVLEIALFILISFFTDKILIFDHVLINKGPLFLSFQYSLKTLFRDLYFIGFATGYFFLITYNKEKRKTNELEKQRLNDIIYRQKSEQELTKAQNAFLKAQINPHFLFNTLDFIYHNIVSLSPTAADTVITLAEMMRYAIDSDKMGDFIPLGDEIDQVENLLYLNQIRKNHGLGFQLQYEKDVRQIHLIPLVLLTMVENIFKHGNLTEHGHDALVHIYLKDGALFIETNNLIDNKKKAAGNHMGLSNIQHRLKYAYGDNITFNYHADESNHFKVQLGIPFSKLKGPGESLGLSTGNDIILPHESADQT
jgi:two-component system LytT family sensor kinase